LKYKWRFDNSPDFHLYSKFIPRIRIVQASLFFRRGVDGAHYISRFLQT